MNASFTSTTTGNRLLERYEGTDASVARKSDAAEVVTTGPYAAVPSQLPGQGSCRGRQSVGGVWGKV